MTPHPYPAGDGLRQPANPAAGGSTGNPAATPFPGRFCMFNHVCRLVTLLIAVILVWNGPAYSQSEDARIVVNAAVTVNTVNPLLFGQNLLFAGNTLWNSSLNGIDPAVKPLLKPITPTLVRFPGGSVSDIYLWEDGIGFRTTAPVNSTSATINLDGTPDWQTVKQARLLDAHSGQLGERFNFSRQNGSQLEGIFGIKGLHPAGALVRPEARQGQPDWFSNSYGTMEFLKLVHSLRAKPLFTVNYSTGLDKSGRLSDLVSLSQRVKRAAAWVAFVNGRPDDPRPLGLDGEGHDWRTVGFWAQKRVALGHPRPYGVTYWEVGNEVYDKNEKGVTSARQYAQDFIIFARAMKGVDPHIQLGAVGMTRPRGLGDADATDAWNPTVVKTAGDYLDFLVIHPYYPAGGLNRATYQSQPWLTAMMAGAHQALADLREIRRVINANSPPGKSIGIAVTEYGIWPAASKDPGDFSNLGRALYDSDLLLGLLQNSSKLGITLAAAWNLHGSNPTADIGYNWQTGARTLRPQYHALALIMDHLGPDLVETHVNSPTFAVPKVNNVLAASAIPLLHAVAFASPASRRLDLMVINRALTAPIATAIQLQGFTPQAGARVWTLSGNRISDNNEHLATTVAPRSGQISDAGPGFSYTFGPHSLTVIQFQAQP